MSVESEMMQFADQVKKIFISQLIKGISRSLHKLLRFFNAMDISILLMQLVDGAIFLNVTCLFFVSAFLAAASALAPLIAMI